MQTPTTVRQSLLVAFCAPLHSLIWTGVGVKNIVGKKLAWRLCAMTGTARDCNMAAPQCLCWLAQGMVAICWARGGGVILGLQWGNGGLKKS